MQVIKAIYGQELADVVYDDYLFEAADLNGGSITDTLIAGAQVTVPEMPKRRLFDEIIAPAEKVTVVTAQPGQTWVDMVLQQLGDEHKLFDLVDLNGTGITDDLIPGTVIECPAYDLDKKAIINILQVKRPASEKIIPPGEPQPEGIEYWAIELDFVVS